MRERAVTDVLHEVLVVREGRHPDPLRALTRILGVAQGTVQSRLGRLEREGLITSLAPRLSPAGMGYPVVAQEVTTHLGAIAEVIEAHSVAGELPAHPPHPDVHWRKSPPRPVHQRLRGASRFQGVGICGQRARTNADPALTNLGSAANSTALKVRLRLPTRRHCRPTAIRSRGLREFASGRLDRPPAGQVLSPDDRLPATTELPHSRLRSTGGGTPIGSGYRFRLRDARTGRQVAALSAAVRPAHPTVPGR